MPWRTAVDQRLQFVNDVLAGCFKFSELCERYSVSRKTGYKWFERFAGEGRAGLIDRSHAAKTCPHRTNPAVVEKLLAARCKHPTWGARKLLDWMIKRKVEPKRRLPAASTAADILQRHGLVAKRRRRRSRPPSERPHTVAVAPNDVWTDDFKGEFPTCDRRYCYPLTIADDLSRFLITVRALPSTKQEGAFPVFERAFRTFGLPLVIRTDNGVPFASTGLGRLSKLSVWWLKLGIRVERIPPGEPSYNGRHERIHRTLKQECTRPPAQNLRRQQLLFDVFRDEYNLERPHEGIDMATPASLYHSSPRPFPKRLPEVVYPGHYHLRKVGGNGAIRWQVDTIFLSHALDGEWVGLYEIDNGIWSIEFTTVELGRYDERTHRFHTGGAMGPRPFNKTQP